MAESHNPKTQNQDHKPTIPPPPTKPSINGSSNGSNSGQKIRFQNPPETINPDAATLKDQWRFAIRQYSRWYSHAWGTAIFAGGAFFALGWIIKDGKAMADLVLAEYGGRFVFSVTVDELHP
ncbi:hypothetical protein BVRB_8g182280 isoform B [Beta vulgaris subsp. vulgaris]|uniref:uncharacterized protein LOC104900604 isoform X2 n=1 Tax=Beta vulgaris subsp. vulgaris TaxID=3555 RepID=UPI00053F67A1|nr:uncharacterized protein LOC104900604 isoform X2 [Beta vulgaris subsp. vulgaris]KMT04572.1 hypothetical protein BVRB_8g182280 isoform B [Beta vulgaris subsp. vulgaris]